MESPKIFFARLRDIAGRLDPSFYSPQYRELDEALANCRYECYDIRDLRIEVFQGVSRNLLENDGIRLLKVKNILPDGSIDFADTEPISDVPTNKILKDGDIISPFIGAAIKGYKFGYFEDRGGERWSFDNNTGVFRNNDERVLSRYLWSFFQLEITHRQLDRIIGGGGVPYLGTEYAKRLRVILPPLPEQRKIVAELDAAYAAKRAADEKATKLRASIDDMVLSELGVKKNDKLDTSLASRIFTVSSSSICNGRFDPKYAFFSRRFAAFKYPTAKLGALLSEPPAYGAGEAGVERISKQQPRYVRITDIDENGDMLPGLGVTAQNIDSAYFLRDGDILFARSGNTVGKTYLHRIKDIQDECIYAGYMIRFRFTDAVLPEYVFAYTQTSYYHEWVQMVQRTAGQPNINAQEYRGMTIPVPPLTVQKRIASTASSIRAEARKLKADATAALDAAKRKIEEELMIKEN